MEAIYAFDLKIFEWISNNLWCGWLNEVMKVITRLGDGGILWIVVAVLLLLAKRYRKYGVMVLISLLCSLLINDNIIKVLVERPRPFDYLEWESFFVYPGIIEKPGSYSFPSGHTASSFAAIIPLFMANKKFGIPATVIAVTIAFSRVYLHVHYTTDVLAGIAVGLIYGLIAWLIVDKLVPLIKRRIRVMRIRKLYRQRQNERKK